MTLYKNTKVKVHLPDGNIDIVAGVLRGDTLALYLFIIYQHYVLQTSIHLMKENGSTLKKARSRWYLTETIMDAGYADNIALLTNLSCIVWSRQQVALAFMWMQTKWSTHVITKKETSPLKMLVLWNQWTSSCNSEAASHLLELTINMRLIKAWTAINRLSIIWKSDLSDKIKCNFFQSVVVSILPYGCTT